MALTRLANVAASQSLPVLTTLLRSQARREEKVV